MFNKGVQYSDTFQAKPCYLLISQIFQNRTSKSSLTNILFNSDDSGDFSGKGSYQLDIKWLYEATVYYCRRNTIFFEHGVSRKRFVNGSTDGKDNNIISFCEHLTLADGYWDLSIFQFFTFSSSPGISNRNWAIMGNSCGQHSAKFIFILGRHNHHIRKASKIR